MMVAACDRNADNAPGDNDAKTYVVDVKNDIKSFNPETGEIAFQSGEIQEALVSSVTSFDTNTSVTFRLDNQVVFESIPMFLSVSSQVYNDLVVLVELSGSKFYLLNGYPSVDVLGDSKEAIVALREENLSKRQAEWDSFVDYLQNAGKISSVSTEVRE